MCVCARDSVLIPADLVVILQHFNLFKSDNIYMVVDGALRATCSWGRFQVTTGGRVGEVEGSLRRDQGGVVIIIVD